MTNIRCTKCGLVNFATATECKRCHTAFVPGETNELVNTFGDNSNSFNRGAAPPSGNPSPGAELYYQPSGGITVLGVVAGLLGGLSVGALAAVVYSYVISYIPFVYITFFATVGFAALLGAIVGNLMKWGKVRSTGVCVLVTLVVTFVAYYVSWAVWIAVTVSSSEFDVSSLAVAQNPFGMMELLLKINEHGAWSMFGVTVSGIALWIIWVIEALILLVGAPVIAWGILTSHPFCESCQEWCDEDKGVATLALTESADLKKRVESKDFEFLKSVGVCTENARMWYRLDLHKCPSCNNTNALTLKLESLTVDKKGKSNVRASEFMDKLLLTAAEVNRIRKISSELSQTRQAA